MSNRWKVTRAGFPTWLPGEHWWQVQELGDDGYWYADPDGMFSHFAPALAYADHRARTITVTLPRTPGRAEIRTGGLHDQPMIIDKKPNGDYRISEGEVEKGPLSALITPFVDLAPDEIEPVALTLLALARKGDSGGA